ncbi:predicted protein [Plenodomus lingam JN3]|uniref:Predicted protein n=1 Tax=Leptosphaeria maculans (strain JN3 / isolate v23.1.3 / race Av1-4-5-6-7-8) TaxID=985895 RepID=E4ZQR9_LEPMJ|nr:predicted protein [Plenodomus lingam JN3]CBX94074.1 predicted protein [Plenodomus lingam JN3]
MTQIEDNLGGCIRDGSSGVVRETSFIGGRCLCTLKDTLWRMHKACTFEMIMDQYFSLGSDGFGGYRRSGPISCHA